MELLVAGVDDIKFNIEIALDEQHGARPLPYNGMDRSMATVCSFYAKGLCSKGALCPMRHLRGDRTVVCKHWLRSLCKKGNQCEYLHEYDMTKMAECYFYARLNVCHNKDCPFLHIDPESKLKDCPWYDRGFCRHGPNCKNKHVRRVLCMNYISGFCPDGPNCKFFHSRFELPAYQKDFKKIALVCHFCCDTGHIAMHCPKNMVSDHVQIKPELEVNNEPWQTNTQAGFGRKFKPLEEVTCFKCGFKGHYANKCPKGHLAFLSSQNIQALQNNQGA